MLVGTVEAADENEAIEKAAARSKNNTGGSRWRCGAADERRLQFL
jgi:hypothetical protein